MINTTSQTGRLTENIFILPISILCLLLQQATISCGWLIQVENRNCCSATRVSTDGSQIAYVAISSVFSANGPNQLFLANADGTNAHAASLSGLEWKHNIIDAPLFLPDGKTILFSSPVQRKSSLPGLVDTITGVVDAEYAFNRSDFLENNTARTKTIRAALQIEYYRKADSVISQERSWILDATI
jgi:Tol biopolymer transport system component